MLLKETLEDSVIRAIHQKVISKLKIWSANLSDLQTGNSKLNTKIFDNLENYMLHDDIGKGEYPFLWCDLDNGNQFLMTTEKMTSTYNYRKYKLEYAKYKGPDWDYWERSKPIEEGTTKIFKYYSLAGEEFYYEIDSNYPAFFANNIILQAMQEVTERIKHGTLEYFINH